MAFSRFFGNASALVRGSGGVRVCGAVLCAALALAAGEPAVSESSVGWRRSAVVVSDGYPRSLSTVTIPGDPYSSLIFLDQRRARLEVIRFGARSSTRSSARVSFNEPPMAKGFASFSVALPPQPHGLAVIRDQGRERILITTLRARLIEVALSATTGRVIAERDLLRAEQAWAEPVAWRGPEGLRLLIATGQGLQAVDPDGVARATWLSPQDASSSDRVQVFDADGDSRTDVFESDLSERNAPLRLRRGQADGTLSPAQPIFDRSLRDALVLRPNRVAIIPSEARDVISIARLQSAANAEETLGRRLSLPLGGTVPMCGLDLPDGVALVMADKRSPQFTVIALRPDGWGKVETFPAVPRIVAMAAAPGGTLLMQVEGEADPFVSTWRDGRLTYPQAMAKPAASASSASERKLIGFGAAGREAWWVTKSDADLLLTVGSATSAFPGAGSKATKATWLGGNRLLVSEHLARNPRLRTPTSDREAPSIEHNSLRVLPTATGGWQVLRLDEGVAQRLGDDLRANDQIMLPEGQRLIDIAVGEGRSLLALEAGGKRLHLLLPDKAGVQRSQRTWDLDAGDGLIADPRLGLMIRQGERLSRLVTGTTPSLQVAFSSDLATLDTGERRGRARADRLFALDLDGDGNDELIISDDEAHRLIACAVSDDKMTLLASWPVFDEGKYPYGGDGRERRSRANDPRSLVCADLDGDGRRDLAMLVHDRILIYLTGSAP